MTKLEKPMTDIMSLEEPLKVLAREGRPMSFFANLTIAKGAGIIIGVTIIFFVLLFITIFSAVRLGIKHKTA